MTILLEVLDAHPEIQTYDQLFQVLEEFEFQCFLDFVAEREAEHG